MISNPVCPKLNIGKHSSLLKWHTCINFVPKIKAFEQGENPLIVIQIDSYILRCKGRSVDVHLIRHIGHVFRVDHTERMQRDTHCETCKFHVMHAE